MTALPRTTSDDPAEIAARIARNVVYCTRCDACQSVDGEACSEKGWPVHCRATMTIDTQAERRAYYAQDRRAAVGE